MAGAFSDIQTLRRTREHTTQGAVTPGCRADIREDLSH
jgi:hypothetical protein